MRLIKLFSAHGRRLKKRQSGSVAVEMALLSPVFFLLLMGVVELGLMFGAQEVLENAAYNTSRLAKTGFAGTGLSQAQTVSQQMTQELQAFGSLINTSNVTITSVAYNSFASIGSGGTSGMGTPQQIVVYTITYPWQFFTPMVGQLLGAQNPGGNWIKNLTANIVVRNEPY